MSEEAKAPSMPAAFYACLLPQLVTAARSKGYALAVHGSMRRDLDLIAVPWVEGAASETELVDALLDVVAIDRDVDRAFTHSRAAQKLHGRRAYLIHLNGTIYLDVSVMPRSA